MKVDERVAQRQVPMLGGIHVLLVGLDVNHVGYEHIVRAEADYLLYLALYAQGRLFDVRGAYNLALAKRQPHLPELVVVLARAYSAPVGSPCHVLGCEVYNELHVLFDDGVGMPFGAYRYIAHCRVGTYSSSPSNGYGVVLVGSASAGY